MFSDSTGDCEFEFVEVKEENRDIRIKTEPETFETRNKNECYSDKSVPIMCTEQIYIKTEPKNLVKYEKEEDAAVTLNSGL